MVESSPANDLTPSSCNRSVVVVAAWVAPMRFRPDIGEMVCAIVARLVVATPFVVLACGVVCVYSDKCCRGTNYLGWVRPLLLVGSILVRTNSGSP
jgi:hypothetical protein